MYRYMCAVACVCAWAFNRGQRSKLDVFLSHPSHDFLRQSLLLTLEVTNLATLASQQAPLTSYFHLLNCRGYEYA